MRSSFLSAISGFPLGRQQRRFTLFRLQMGQVFFMSTGRKPGRGRVAQIENWIPLQWTQFSSEPTGTVDRQISSDDLLSKRRGVLPIGEQGLEFQIVAEVFPLGMLPEQRPGYAAGLREEFLEQVHACADVPGTRLEASR
jgi:hypothetical protein